MSEGTKKDLGKGTHSGGSSGSGSKRTDKDNEKTGNR
jgi:hypothetical protein